MLLKNTLPNFNTKLWCLMLSFLLYNTKFTVLIVSKTTILLFPKSNCYMFWEEFELLLK